MSANKYDEFDLKPDSEDEVVNNRPDYEKEILDIIHSNASPKLMREELEDYHANDIAEVMLKLSAPERQKLYRILDVNMLSEILES
ncbi:MAG: magnesium transporter, partial [Holdemanella sp.]|nr:magnesium transporter [Holdemanella sp.]